MKKRYILTAVLALALICLTGCLFKPSEALYTLPAASEDFTDLQAKINRVQTELSSESAGAVEFAAPLQGENTQTIQLQDLDGDGEQDSAVAFFRVAGADKPLRIYVFRQKGETGYEVASIIEGDGAAINSIYYADLDQQAGKELIVSWQMSEDVYMLSAYSIREEEPLELMKSAYSSYYEVTDIDRDSQSEILLIQLDPVNGNRAELYDCRENTMELTSSSPLSTGVTSIFKVKTNFVTGLLPALYVTSYFEEGQHLVTDIFVVKAGALQNITLEEPDGVSRTTVRAVSDVESTDVNNDYILELPRLTVMPTTSAVEVFYAITWEQYDENGAATDVSTTFHNVKDGWFLILPDAWTGRVAVQRSDSVTSNDSQRTITFGWWQENGKLEPFLSIYRFTGNNRTVRATRGNRFILKDSSDVIYAAEFYESSRDCGLTQETLAENFRLIVSEW